MPRIYDSRSDPYDFCFSCFPDNNEAEERFMNNGDGPDERGNCYGYDAEHPAYRNENYKCEDCDKLLDDEDDAQ
jgi:hypothetical protein